MCLDPLAEWGISLWVIIEETGPESSGVFERKCSALGVRWATLSLLKLVGVATHTKYLAIGAG